MPRASASLGAVVEREKRASIWAWPILTVAFIVFGIAKLVIGFIGLFYRTSK
ncbi:MAG: hypothetical protein WCO79_01150 [bacterium]